MVCISGTPSVVSVQSSTDIVAALVDGQVREGQRGYASIQQLKKMEFPNFCKNFNGLHMVGVLGVTKNDDQSQYHMSEVMASDMGLPGVELAGQGPITPADQARAVTGDIKTMWTDVGHVAPEQIPKQNASWYRSCFCCRMSNITPEEHSGMPGGDTSGSSKRHQMSVAKSCGWRTGAHSVTGEEWREVAFLKWKKTPWAFLPEAQQGVCIRHKVSPTVFPFPTMHSLFVAYHKVIEEFRTLQQGHRDRVMEDRRMALPEEDEKFDFLRVPIKQRINPEEAETIFNYLRTKVSPGHLTKALAEQANTPIGTMCRTKKWRPGVRGGGVSDPTSEYLDDSDE